MQKALKIFGLLSILAVCFGFNQQIVGPPPKWVNVKAYGAKGDGVTDDTAAIQSAMTVAASVNGILYCPLGTYVTSSTLTVTPYDFIIAGDGKLGSVIHYTGNGIAIDLGGAGGNTGNNNMRVENIGITGTASGTVGIRLSLYNGLYLRDVWVSAFTNGSCVQLNGSNVGTILNCQFLTSSIGLEFVENGANFPNLFTMIGGEIGGCATAIVGRGNGNRIEGVNIASTSTSPAVMLRENAENWIIKGCYFENNAVGVGSSSIQLGIGGGASGDGCVFTGNVFYDTCQYGVHIANGNHNYIYSNHDGGLTVSLVLLDSGVTTTSIGYNRKNVAIVTDNSASGSTYIQDFASTTLPATLTLQSDATHSNTLTSATNALTISNPGTTTTFQVGSGTIVADKLSASTGRVTLAANNNIGTMTLSNAATNYLQLLEAGEVWITSVQNENLVLRTNNTSRWTVAAAGNLLASTDASFSIGASAANRPTALFLSAPSITAGSGTGITVNDSGSVRRLTYKVTVTFAALAAAGLTADATICTIPAKTKIVGIYADTTTNYHGGGTTAATLIVGKTVGGNEYVVSHDVWTATITKGLADADLGTSINRASAIQGGDLPSWTGTTNVSVRLTTVTANTNTLTQGSTTYYIDTVSFQ